MRRCSRKARISWDVHVNFFADAPAARGVGLRYRAAALSVGRNAQSTAQPAIVLKRGARDDSRDDAVLRPRRPFQYAHATIEEFLDHSEARRDMHVGDRVKLKDRVAISETLGLAAGAVGTVCDIEIGRFRPAVLVSFQDMDLYTSALRDEDLIVVQASQESEGTDGGPE